MNVLAITGTKGRHSHLENLVRMYLDQDYMGESILIIFNNSEVEQKLDDIDLPYGKNIILVNSPVNSHTKQPYSSVGEIFNDCLTHIRASISDEWLKNSLATHMDCDDIFLPNHFSQGVLGYYTGKFKSPKVNAYKPRKSWYVCGDHQELSENCMEPSVFMEWNHLIKVGYLNTSATYNWGWLNTCNLYMDDEEPTFIYHWGNGTYKISGDDKNPENFNNARKSDNDEGDGVITPVPNVNDLYNIIKK